MTAYEAKKWTVPVLYSLPILIIFLNLALSIVLDFQQLHNDFWDVFFVARTMVWEDRQSWFNPQYPIGYCFFLKLIMGSGLPVVSAILANLVFTGITLAVSAIFYRKLFGAVYAIVTILALAFFPEFYHYANAGGGDPGAVTFFSLGFFLLLSVVNSQSKKYPRPGIFLVGGLCLGVAGLFRYHALVASGMLILAFWISYPGRWKSWIMVSVGVCVGYSPQWGVNLTSGRGLLETQFGPMNVYYLMHAINWYHISDLKLSGSAFSIIAMDPVLFFKKYLLSIWSFKQAWMPPLLAYFLNRRFGNGNKSFQVVLIWMILYFLLFSATTSGRQVLLALPFSFLAFGYCLRWLWENTNAIPGFFNPRIRYTSISIFILLLLIRYGVSDLKILQTRLQQRNICKSIEAHVIKNGCKRASQVYTSDFDFYFRTLPPYIPYFNGGAPRLGTYHYNQAFPEFPVTVPTEFVEACRAHGVQFVILSSDCRSLSEELGSLYNGEISWDGLVPEIEFGDRKVFKVQ